MKRTQKGGDKPGRLTPEIINRFSDPDMEWHMNPLYGLIYCNIGLVSNYYNLTEIKSKSINAEESKIIKETCYRIPGTQTIKPTKKIFEKINPKEIGIFIAAKYLNKVGEKKIIFVDNNKLYKSEYEIETKQFEKIREIVIKINKFVPMFRDYKKNASTNASTNASSTASSTAAAEEVDTIYSAEPGDLFIYRMLLYYLWWIANDEKGIDDYYEGVKEIFDIANITMTGEGEIDYTFEKAILPIIYSQNPIQIYNQDWALHFCHSKEQQTYPDCGESSVRNLINILCFENDVFNLKLLEEKGAIPELLEYYSVFGDFSSQSKTEKKNIFGLKLNARDAWSKLLIDHAQKNVKFLQQCISSGSNSSGGGAASTAPYSFEIRPGTTTTIDIDGLPTSVCNLLAVIHNLLPAITTWKQFENKNIEINEEEDIKVDKDCVGNIIFKHFKYGRYKLHLQSMHYYVEHIDKVKSQGKPSHVDKRKNNIINYLLKDPQYNPDEDEYLHFNYTDEELLKLFYYIHLSSSMAYCLFELSITDKHNNDDMRQRLKIDVNSEYFNKIVANYGKDPIINKYAFKSKNLNFLKMFPELTHLNFIIPFGVTEMDLTQIEKSKITSLGNYFLHNFGGESIDLEQLKNIKTIGNMFLCNSKLTKVDLSPLENIESLQIGFMCDCDKLIQVNATKLMPKLKTLGHNCFSFIKNNPPAKTTFNLSGFQNVEIIGDNAFNRCNIYCEEFDFSIFQNVRTIGERFMTNCFKIGFAGKKPIDLSCLQKLETIGDYFLSDCSGLESIILKDLHHLRSIGNSFCFFNSTARVDLIGLENLETIGNAFLNNMLSLESVNFVGLPKLTTIGNDFLKLCKKMTTINFTGFASVRTIGNNFMMDCDGIESYRGHINTFDITPLTNLESVGENFLQWNSLKPINYPALICTAKQKEMLEKTGHQFTGGNDTIMGGRGRKTIKRRRNNKRQTKRRGEGRRHK